MALAHSKAVAVDPRVDALGPTAPSGCLAAARADALERLRELGLPGRRDEYWKYTRPETLTQADVIPATILQVTEKPLYDDIERVKLVFVDGVFDAAASDDLAIAGVTIERLAEVAVQDIHWAREFYGVLETAGQSPVARPLSALNTAYAREGAVIRVSGTAAKAVSLIYRRKAEDADVLLHHLIKVEDGAEVTVVENGPGAARLNTVMEVDIGAGGTFHHVRTQGRDHERRAATHIFARLSAEAVFKSFTMTANGALTRNDVVVQLTGDNGVAHIAGVCVGDGDFHHDDTVFVTHDAVNCESRQVFKKVLRNGATGVFQGKILVKQGAQKTDGYQISQALMLDDDSQFLAKPELEIYADDVACSHGSTSGAIDETALFYLRSRGVPTNEATDLLTLAFLAQAIDEIDDPAIAADILTRLEAWLVRRRG